MAGSAVTEGSRAIVTNGGGAVWFGRPDSRWKTAVWVGFTLGICLHFALSYNLIIDFLDLDAYMRGVEKTPYQYRILMMYVFRFFATRHAVIALAQHAQHMRHAPLLFQKPTQLVQIGIAIMSLFGAVLATAATLTRLTGDRIFSRWMSLLLIYMAYANLAPGWGLAYTFPYDTPSLMFFCLGVFLVVSGRNRLYYALYPIAVLNRETICFLTIFFLIWKWQEIRAREGRVTSKDALRLAAHGVVQGAIWVGLKLWLAHRFAANIYDYGSTPTNPPVVGRMMLNVHMLLRPQQWPVYLSVFGFLLPVILLQRRWIGNPGIDYGCTILIPIWFVGMFFMGLMPEIRIFSELSALLVPAMGLIVYHRFAPVAAEPSGAVAGV
ncbi:hypothetical protein [Tunturibacter empetritectus]|nr:hypothetical protein [Edaphobacter lichenicola]